MTGASVTILGLAEARARLMALQPKQYRAEERTAMRAAAQVGARAFGKASKSSRTRAKGFKVSVSVTNTDSEARILGNRYAGFEEMGTRAHIIRPRKAKTVSFRNRKGKTVSFRTKAASRDAVLYFNGHFSRQVRHPGSAARPFVRQALADNEGAIAKKYGEVVTKRMQKLGIL